MLLDPGAQLSFISKEFAARLGLQPVPHRFPVEGIGPATVMTMGSVIVDLLSIHEDRTAVRIEFHVLESISSFLPAEEINKREWSHLDGLQLADSSFERPGPIDMLVGADSWGLIIRDGVITSAREEPCAMCTCFGWVVLGRTRQRPVEASGSVRCHLATVAAEESLDVLLKRFWDLEEPTMEVSGTANDLCEQIFVSTLTRVDGQYCVQIPFRPDAKLLGDSYEMARMRFMQLEKQLVRDEDLRAKYVDFMNEYIRLGHMEQVEVSLEDRDSGYYIPHHAVKEKFRVVFDASAHTSNGVSLNDTQLTGRRIQDTLVEIIHRFRRFEFAVTADVQKMFRAVLVDPRHRRFQRILWREHPGQQLKIFELKTVTYGLASSPFCAVRALQQCADDNVAAVPDRTRGEAARDVIRSSFYVDDLLLSAETTGQASELAKDVDVILREGEFHLRKWNSNNTRVLRALDESGEAAEELQLNDLEMASVLGLQWNPATDSFSYRVNLTTTDRLTKRKVTSVVGRLFDPVGFLAPVLITGKVLIQSLWKVQLDWDATLPEDQQLEWNQFRESLIALEEISVPRWMGISSRRRVSYVGFCDASSRACAGVIYVRHVTENGDVNVSLVAAKTKVAPIKNTTIPRLELAAAVLLVKLWIQVRTALGCEDAPYSFYSDSTIALSWIRNSPVELKEFVSNRVQFIQSNTDANRWFHVRSENNPADCASRGMSAAALKEYNLWWSGPDELRDHRVNEQVADVDWTPENRALVAVEQRPVKVRLVVNKSMFICARDRIVRDRKKPTDPPLPPAVPVIRPLVDKFSCYMKLLHVTALVFRVSSRRRESRGNGFITTKELNNALWFHVREAQQAYYGEERKLLLKNEPVGLGSPLKALNPFVDDEGVIRVSGRLNNARLAWEQRQPVLIPRDSGLCKLIIAYAHRVTCHGGIQEMLQYIRRRFWIVTGRARVKSFVNRCMACKLRQRMTAQQQMAILPRSRVLPAPPFFHTGVDYCGPFDVRMGGPRSKVLVKTYGVVFVCMVTRSVHLDLAEDLSTQGFLDVYDRFISRRGICAVMHSDNGTQFSGASKQMRSDLVLWRSSAAHQHLADYGTEWRFITPAAPFHGGLWEAAVRSMKKHLYKVKGQRIFTFNQLSTLLIRIEGIMNSRPLIAIHDDVEGGMALTPAHFLVRRPIVSRPVDWTRVVVADNRLRHHQLMQKMVLEFWKEWQRDYLNELQARAKWFRPHPNLRIGDVVALKDEDLPPSRWHIGRIIDVFPGRDGLVRSVEVTYNTRRDNEHGLFAQHVCQRPVQKVCRLIEADEEIQEQSVPAGEGVQEIG